MHRNLKSYDTSRFAIFDGLDAEQRTYLQPYLHNRWVDGETTFLRQNQSGSGLYLLVQGSVKVFLEPPINAEPRSVRETIVAICGPGETLGEIDTADGGGHTASIATLEGSKFLWMAGEDFWRCQERIPQLGRNLSCILAKRLRWATTIHDILSALHLPGKVAYQLLLLARDYGLQRSDGSILLPLRLTQSEMAALVGSSRECVNRVLSTFRQRGYVQTKRDVHIIIHDVESLRSFCRGLAPSVDSTR